MTGGPDHPYGQDPYAPVDYPTGAGLPPPVHGYGYPPPGPYPNTGYPPPAPGYGPAGQLPPAGRPVPAAGYPYDPYDPYRPVRPPGTNGKAVAALVTSLAGLVLCGLPSIVGLILGIVAMRETRRTGQEGYGVALAGVIVGAVVTIGIVLYLVVIVGIVTSGVSVV